MERGPHRAAGSQGLLKTEEMPAEGKLPFKSTLKVALTFLLVLPLPVQAKDASSEPIEITVNEAIKYGNKEIVNRGQDIASFEIDVDKRWAAQLKSEPKTLSHYPELAENLKDRSYWAISYHTNVPLRRGGSYTVFVEKNSGQILGVIVWE